MANRYQKNKGVKPVYTFAICWLLLSGFLPMFRLGTILLSLGISGVLSYYLGKSGSRKEKAVEEAIRQEKIRAAQVKPQYTSQRVKPQSGAQYVSQRVDPVTPSQKKSYGPEIDPIVEEGNRALSEMGRLYMSIKDNDVRSKINELMRITDKITQDAIADPSDIPQIKKFMNYYLPTTIKLLNSYDRMSAIGVEGENLDKSMKNINDMLDAAIVAYKKRLDSLFANQALDIETDIDVMNTMLAREGLTENRDFQVAQSGGES